MYCKEKVHDEGRSVGFHDCVNTAVTVAGYCKVHDPELKAARAQKRPKCAHVDESTGNPDCAVSVNGSKYCSWHAESVTRHRVYAQSQRLRETLDWLKKLDGAQMVRVSDLVGRMEVVLKNA